MPRGNQWAPALSDGNGWFDLNQKNSMTEYYWNWAKVFSLTYNMGLFCKSKLEAS